MRIYYMQSWSLYRTAQDEKPLREENDADDWPNVLRVNEWATEIGKAQKDGQKCF